MGWCIIFLFLIKNNFSHKNNFPWGEREYVPLAKEQVLECLSQNYKG